MEEKEIKSAPYLICLCTLFFLCGGFVPLYFFYKVSRHAYVCTYVRMCFYMHVYFVNLHACFHLCIYSVYSTRVRTYVCSFVCMFFHILHLSICTCVVCMCIIYVHTVFEQHTHAYFIYCTYILYTVDPHLSEHLGTKGWSDMRNIQITETGLNVL